MCADDKLDKEMMQEARPRHRNKAGNAAVRQETPELAANRERLDLRELRGSNLIDEDYNYKALR